MASADEVQASLDRRLASMQEYSLVQLRECRGPLSLHAELVDGIRQDLGVIDSQLEELTLLAEDEETEAGRQRVMGTVDNWKRRIDNLRKQIREATLSSKRRIDSNDAASQREELFRSANRTSASLKGVKGATSKDDELMSATANVTDGLRRTRQLMEQELEKSSLSAQMLERSSQTLTLTTNQYSSFSDLLQTSKNLITTLEKADTLDRLLITAALVFFFLVCLLIIKRRILDRGIRAATLVGKVAGGVGGVGKKGVQAVLKEQAISAASVLSSTASLVATAATAVSTGKLGRSPASLPSSAPHATAAHSHPGPSDEFTTAIPEPEAETVAVSTSSAEAASYILPQDTVLAEELGNGMAPETEDEGKEAKDPLAGMEEALGLEDTDDDTETIPEATEYDTVVPVRDEL